MDYRFSVESFEASYDECEVLYQAHYSEMQKRLAGQGEDIPDYAPRLDEYFAADRGGYLIHYCVRTTENEPVGYSNIYLTHSMHNGEFMATEDAIFVRADHRNGIGRVFSRFILADLKRRGVKRLEVVALTDLRVAKLWKRMGFKEIGTVMSFNFEG